MANNMRLMIKVLCHEDDIYNEIKNNRSEDEKNSTQILFDDSQRIIYMGKFVDKELADLCCQHPRGFCDDMLEFATRIVNSVSNEKQNVTTISKYEYEACSYRTSFYDPRVGDIIIDTLDYCHYSEDDPHWETNPRPTEIAANELSVNPVKFDQLLNESGYWGGFADPAKPFLYDTEVSYDETMKKVDHFVERALGLKS